MHLIELFCEMDELSAWLLSKTILAAWYWIFPKKTDREEETQKAAAD